MTTASTDAVIAGSKGFALALLAPLTERVGSRPRIAADPVQAIALCREGGLLVFEFQGEGSLRAIQDLVLQGTDLRIVAAVPPAHAAAEGPLRALGIDLVRWDGTPENVLGAVSRQLSAAEAIAAAAAARARPAPPAGAAPASKPVAAPPAASAARPGPAPAMRPVAAPPGAPAARPGAAPAAVAPAVRPAAAPPGAPAVRPVAAPSPGPGAAARPAAAPAPAAAPRPDAPPAAVHGAAPVASPAAAKPTAAPSAPPRPAPPRPVPASAPSVPRSSVSAAAAKASTAPTLVPPVLAAPAPRPAAQAFPAPEPLVAPAPAALRPPAPDVREAAVPESAAAGPAAPAVAAAPAQAADLFDDLGSADFPLDVAEARGPGVAAPSPPSDAVWPANVPGSEEAAGALERGLAGHFAPPGTALAAVADVVAGLSDLERSVLAGEPQPIATEPIRRAAVIRVRVAAALATVPPSGGSSDAGAVSSFLAEIDALLSEVNALASSAPPELQASLEAVRNSLVKEAIDLSEAAQLLVPAGDVPAAAVERRVARAPQTRVLSVSAEDVTKAPPRNRAMWIALAVAVAIGGWWHGSALLRGMNPQVERPPTIPGAPTGMFATNTAPSAPKVLLPTQGAPDAAEVERFKLEQELKGNKVQQLEGGAIIVLPQGTPGPGGK